MDNKKENFSKITPIKKKIVCCFLCLFVVICSTFSVFAGSISIQDGPFTVSVGTNFPVSVSLPAQETVSSSLVFGTFDLPCFTRLYLVCNDSAYWKKLSHFKFTFNINTIVSTGVFTSYPSGAQFTNNVRLNSFISDDLIVSVSGSKISSSVYQIDYDVFVLPVQNEQHRVDCGFSMYGNVLTAKTSAGVISLSANPSYSVIGTKFELGIADSDSNILNSISNSLKQLTSQAATDSTKLQQLISLTTSTNTLLTNLQHDLNSGFSDLDSSLGVLNGTIKTESGNIINAVNLNAQTVKQQLVTLQNTLVSSLEAINRTLILINNNIVTFDSNVYNAMRLLLAGLGGVDLGQDLQATNGRLQEIISNVQENWASIIEKGLDKIAPDTGALDDDMSNVSDSLDSISKGDLISGITGSANQDNAKTAFDTASSFFSGFGTKILYFNNRLMDIYNSLGDFRYVLIMTMVIGLITFIFKVGNTFMRSHSGGGKDINLPRKLR